VRTSYDRESQDDNDTQARLYFDPPATADEVQAAALRYVRKVGA
jgi:hypothetical protein